PEVPGAAFPEARAYLAGFPFIGQVLRSRRRAQGYRRIGYDHHLDRYLLTYGYFRASLEVLGRLGPKLLLLSNDHNMETRTLEHAASRLGIRTAYVQHASVAHGFPPLAFNLAFLDGLDAARKYDQPGYARSQVFLTGIPKGDAA